MEPRRDASSRASSHSSRVMSVAQPPAEDSNHEPKRVRMEIRPAFCFSNEDKVGTIQPHNDTIMVTHRIRGGDMM